MIIYELKNVNPKNRRTGDCSTRAILGIVERFGITYEQVIDLQCYFAKKKCYGLTNKETTTAVLEYFGYEKQKQPRKRDNSKYLVGEIDLVLTKKQLQEGVLISMAHHDSCVVNGRLQDIWDCRMKTIGNYWTYKGDKYNKFLQEGMVK